MVSPANKKLKPIAYFFPISTSEHQSINSSMEELPEELPEELTIDILSRLAVKTIIHCKCVCKKWRNLVLDSCFINLHLSRSSATATGLIIHHNLHMNMTPIQKYGYMFPGTLKWPMPVQRHGFMNPGILKWVEIEDKVDHHHLHPTMSLDLNLAPVLRNSLIEQMGSVNGLICLSQRSHNLDNTYICNPVTREIMILPNKHYYTNARVACGFGVSSSSGEYKVVRIFQEVNMLSNDEKQSRPSVLEAEVYTLGTGQWRSLGRLRYWFYGFYGTFLNDHCHWIVCDEEDAPKNICTFDFNKETFQLFPSPPREGIQESRFHHRRLAVLRDCLCQLHCYNSQFMIWVMKEYGIKKSWHKEVVIPEAIKCDLDWLSWRPISLIKGLNDGSILLVCDGKLCAYYPTSETVEDKNMFYPALTGLAYRPTFLKLQNFELERVQMF